MIDGLTAARALDRAGFRKAVAIAASIARAMGGSKQRFSTDPAGNWVNGQAEGTIVSPTIHTARFEQLSNSVVDHWAWQYAPQSGDTIIDVGAGVGEEALVFSRLVGPEGKIFSIEAHPTTYACLEATIARSGLRNVTPISCAVTHEDGLVSIDDADNHLASSILGTAGGQSVSGRSLDSLASQLAFGEVALLKMNIEGAERLAVRGMGQLSKRIRHLVISCHDFISEAGGGADFRTFDEVRERLIDMGFDVTSRTDHPEPWVRYYLYGRNRNLRA